MKESLWLQPKSKEEMTLLKSLVKKLRIKSSVLSIDEEEDMALGLAILKNRKEKKASKASIIAALKS